MSGPSVSVVVPTRNAARTLDACLASISAQTHPDVELIVVDNDSTDGTQEIASRHTDHVERYGPERSAQRNHGWKVSRGDVVVFIDADMVLDRPILAEAAAVLRADPAIGGVVLPELAFGEGFLAGCRSLEKRLYLDDPRVEAARAFPRRVLEETGGYAPEFSAFEDWELADRVAAAGYRIGRTRSFVWHDEGRIRLGRAFTKKRYYGHWLSQYRHAADRAASDARAPARTLARPALLNRPMLLAAEPHRAAGLVLLKTVEWAGLALGAVEGLRR